VHKIIQLFDAGMSLARFNMSHGTIKVRFPYFIIVVEHLAVQEVPGGEAIEAL